MNEQNKKNQSRDARAPDEMNDFTALLWVGLRMGATTGLEPDELFFDRSPDSIYAVWIFLCFCLKSRCCWWRRWRCTGHVVCMQKHNFNKFCFCSVEKTAIIMHEFVLVFVSLIACNRSVQAVGPRDRFCFVTLCAFGRIDRMEWCVFENGIFFLVMQLWLSTRTGGDDV